MADIVEDGIDVAIRAGFLEDSSLVARRLGGNDRVVVASPSYLERYGEPTRTLRGAGRRITACDTTEMEMLEPLGIRNARMVRAR